jgi:hypothetical protein
MTNRWVLVSLAAGVGAVAPAVLSAQQSPRFPDPRVYNDELSPGQIQRAQEPGPARGSTSTSRAQQQAQPARAVACSGAFAKDSNHLKLATVYKPDNLAFTEVEAPEGKKLMASVLFPKDPKRRLEVWWQNEAARSDIYLIVINGQSTWTAPKGLRLGLQLAAIERLNGKPFKLKGFDKDSIGSVSDWQGGALGSLTGGCKVGAYLRPDPKVSAEAREQVPASAEFASSDASVKAVKPTVAEIIIGY